MSEVWKLDLPRNEILVLLAFADHANDDGIMWPSYDRVAWKTGCSRKTVERMVKDLSGRGILVRQPGPTGRGYTQIFRIVLERATRKPAFVPERSSYVASPLEPEDLIRVPNKVNKGTQLVPPNHQEPSVESRRLCSESESLRDSDNGGANGAPQHQGEKQKQKPEPPGETLDFDTPGSRVLQAKLRENAAAAGRRGPSRFGTLQQKRLLLQHEKRLGIRHLTSAIDLGLTRGCTSLRAIIPWVAKYSPNGNGSGRDSPRGMGGASETTTAELDKYLPGGTG